MKSNILEIEIGTRTNANVYFSCAGTRLRGAWNILEMARHDRSWLNVANAYPKGLPGKRVRVDLDAGSVTLVEPLNYPEWSEERGKLAQRGKKVEDDILVQGAYLPDWLHEMKRAIECGCAVLIDGKLPSDLGEERTDEMPDDRKEEAKATRELVEMLMKQNQEMQAQMLAMQKELVKAVAAK